MARSLRIQFKQEYKEPAYDLLLEMDGGGLWRECGSSTERRKRLSVKQSEAEIGELRASLAWVTESQGIVGSVFPLVETVAIASIRGPQGSHWKDTEDARITKAAKSTDMREDNHENECAESFHYFLNHLPSLRSLYVREVNAPLTITVLVNGGTPLHPITYTRTLHFAADIRGARLPHGSSVIWSSDVPTTVP